MDRQVLLLLPTMTKLRSVGVNKVQVEDDATSAIVKHHEIPDIHALVGICVEGIIQNRRRFLACIGNQ